MLGKTEDLLIILAVILILFGAKKLPELAKGMGQSVKEIRKGFSEATTDDHDSKHETNS